MPSSRSEAAASALIQFARRRVNIRGGVAVGREFHIGRGSVVWAPRRLLIGDRVYVGKYVTIEVDGRIGGGTMIANNVGIVGRSDHDMTELGSAIRDAKWVGEDPDRLSSPVTIGRDVWIGYGAIVLSGVRIGDSSVIASGAVVVDDIPENVIAVGQPAKPLRLRFSADDFKRHERLLDESYERTRSAGI